MNLFSTLRAKPAPTQSRYGLSDLLGQFLYGGQSYMPQLTTTIANSKQEPIDGTFAAFVDLAYRRNGIVFAAIAARALVFSEARFKGRAFRTGDLVGGPWLAPLERPGPNQTTGELLWRMEQDASLAGNWYGVPDMGGVRRLRPDFVSILISSQVAPEDPAFAHDCRVEGYLYQPPRHDPEFYPVEQVAHWSPIPDPAAQFRGMSWLTPVVREIMSDGAATDHKQKFFENAATPNLVVKLPESVMTKEQFDEVVGAMESDHQGVENAYRTLYLAAGADATVVGTNLQQMDFKTTQGAGETRIAVASRVPAVVLGISEGLAGSSLNAGNYGMARRSMADGFLRPQWRSACAALAKLVQVPAGLELWYDESGISFLREDAKDAAEIDFVTAQAVRQAIEAGFEPDAAVAFAKSHDISKLAGAHSGLTSVQLQPPMSGQLPPAA